MSQMKSNFIAYSKYVNYIKTKSRFKKEVEIPNDIANWYHFCLTSCSESKDQIMDKVYQLLKQNEYLFKGLENSVVFPLLLAELLNSDCGTESNPSSHFINIFLKVLKNELNDINNDNDQSVRNYQVIYSNDTLVRRAFQDVNERPNKLLDDDFKIN